MYSLILAVFNSDIINKTERYRRADVITYIRALLKCRDDCALGMRANKRSIRMKLLLHSRLWYYLKVISIHYLYSCLLYRFPLPLSPEILGIIAGMGERFKVNT